MNMFDLRYQILKNLEIYLIHRIYWYTIYIFSLLSIWKKMFD